MRKTERTIEALQNFLVDLDGDNELMDLYGEYIKFAIKCVRYAERNRWHDYDKEKPVNGELIVYNMSDYSDVTTYWEHAFNTLIRCIGEEGGHVYWQHYYNDKLEEDDINAI